jgi:cyclase
MQRATTVVILILLMQSSLGSQEMAGIEVQKLRPNLFLLTGGNANTIVFVATKGVVIIDTKGPIAGWGRAIAEQVKELTPLPITTIINTHNHGDHVGGNVDLQGTKSIIAHENAAAHMRKMALMFPKPTGGGLPTQTFKDRLTIGTGADQIDLYYFGPAHTDSDTFVVIPALKVMVAGDAFQGKLVPALDRAHGGNGVEYPRTLARAVVVSRTVDTVITGHRGVATPKDLAEYANFMRDLLESVRRGKSKGKAPGEIAASWTLPPAYRGYEAPPKQVASTMEWIYKQIR